MMETQSRLIRDKQTTLFTDRSFDTRAASIGACIYPGEGQSNPGGYLSEARALS
jgi:hypothetical protein